MKRLKELRKLRNINQQELADQMSVSRSSVAMWEKGTDPGKEMLQKLAEYFDVSVDYLLEMSDTPKTETPQLDAEALEIYNTISRLSQENQKRIFDLAKALQSSQQ